MIRALAMAPNMPLRLIRSLAAQSLQIGAVGGDGRFFSSTWQIDAASLQHAASTSSHCDPTRSRHHTVGGVAWQAPWQGWKSAFRSYSSSVQANATPDLDAAATTATTLVTPPPEPSQGQPAEPKAETQAAPAAAIDPSRRIYVGNITWTTTSEGLQAALSSCGKVVNIKMGTKKDGRPAGWAFVDFETAEEAAAAVQKLHGTDLNGRMLSVREFKEPTDGSPKQARPRLVLDDSKSSGLQLVVHGLPFSMTADQLRAMFEEVGEVEGAEIAKRQKSSSSKGWGTVRFGSAAAAQRGIELWHKRELDTRKGFSLSVFVDKLA